MDKRLTPARIALIYAVFAVLWIFVSDKLLALAAPDPDLIIRLSTAKGIAFVIVTTMLLYLLSRTLVAQTTRTDAATTGETGTFTLHRLIAIFLCLALIVPMFGYGIAKLYSPHIKKAAFDDLAAIAELKSTQIETWLQERDDDAVEIADRDGLIQKTEQWLLRKDAGAQKFVLARMQTLDRTHGYAPVLLYPDGRPANTSPDPVSAKVWHNLLALALSSGKPQRSDLYLDGSGKTRIDYIVPLRLHSPQRNVGALILRAPVEKFLFPLIQSWPTPSPSAETVLVRQDGNQILFLNELRHRKGAALTLQIPLDSPELPAAASILNAKPRTMEGIDYRGIRVLAATRPVRNTDWHLVAKVDRVEVLALLDQILFWVSLIAIIAVMVVASAVLLLWRQQQRLNQMVLVASTAEKDKELKLFYDLPFIGMAMSSPSSKAWLHANDRLCEMLGYTRAELLQTTWADITYPEDLDGNLKQFERMTSGEIDGYTMEKRFVRKDGTPITVNLDVKCSRDTDGKAEHIFALIEDITERKRTEMALHETEATYRSLYENMLNSVAHCRMIFHDGVPVDYEYISVNPAFGRTTGLQDVVGRRISEVIPGYCENNRDSLWVFGKVAQTGEPVRWDHYLAALGKWLTFAVYSPAPGEFVVVMDDISEGKRAEAELRKSEATYRSLFENMLNGVAHYRMIFRDGVPVDYEFIAVNPAFGQTTGLTDVVGKRVSEVIPGYCEDNQDSLRVFGKVAQTGKPVRWEHYLGALGKWFAFSIYSPAQDEFVVVSEDVTERKHAEKALRESEDLFRNIFTNAIDGILLADGATRKFIMANPAIERMLGYSHEEILTLGIDDIHPADALPGVMLELKQKLAGENTLTHDLQVQRKDGSVFYADVNAAPITIQGKPYLMGLFRDITERKQTEDALRQAATVFESSHDGVTITDLKGRMLAVNRAFLTITGYTEAEVLGRNPSMLHSGRQTKDFYQSMWASIKAEGYWQGEIWNRRKNGEIYPEWLTISAVHDDQGEATRYVGVFSDLSQLKQSETQLEHLAHYDPLTDLPNRLLLQSHLAHALAQAQRHQRQVGVLYLDLDRFKNINDSLGYPIGDELLIALTERLAMRLRSEDMLARLGGDEFLLVLENIDGPEDAVDVARTMLDLLAQPFVLSGKQEVYIGVSIGISVSPDDGIKADELIQHADAAMHLAKKQGRNTYRFYTEALTRAAGEHLELENRLRHAIGANQLRVYFQPQVDIATGHIIGAEALVRWQDPERGLIQPGQFIRLAEETGLIGAIGEWVLQETCLQGVRWIKAGLPYLTLAVNLSPHQFLRGNIPELVSKVLAETGFPADRLELELTESALMDQEEAAVKMLHLLRAQDIRLAIDDFGTGYSSLSYLKRFPLDILKIDKSFVDDIPFHQDDMEIASTIIAMGHILGFKVLAEGVETAEQLAFLQSKGCDMYQGYLCSPPVPAGEFEKLRAARTSRVK